jgi:hypothetical protein
MNQSGCRDVIELFERRLGTAIHGLPSSSLRLRLVADLVELADNAKMGAADQVSYAQDLAAMSDVPVEFKVNGVSFGTLPADPGSKKRSARKPIDRIDPTVAPVSDGPHVKLRSGRLPSPADRQVLERLRRQLRP